MERMTVDELKAKVADLWEKMTAHDHVGKDAKFVSFSMSNPYQAEYSEYARRFQRAKVIISEVSGDESY